jgi:hypothetical protein
VSATLSVGGVHHEPGVPGGAGGVLPRELRRFRGHGGGLYRLNPVHPWFERRLVTTLELRNAISWFGFQIQFVPLRRGREQAGVHGGGLYNLNAFDPGA